MVYVININIIHIINLLVVIKIYFLMYYGVFYYNIEDD